MVGKPFCFETVMSTDRNLKLIQNASKKGFFIRTYIVLTCDSAINVSRVHGRVQSGGHDVPVEKIISRYDRSLRLVKDVVAASHVCNIYDNSSQYHARFSMRTRPLNLHNPLTKLDFVSHPMIR